MSSDPSNMILELGAYGIRKFVVNGVDLTDSVYSVEIGAEAHGVPIVSVAFTGKDMFVAGEAIVDTPTSTPEGILEYLDSLDVQEIESEALSDINWGMESPGRLFIAAMKRQLEDG